MILMMTKKTHPTSEKEEDAESEPAEDAPADEPEEDDHSGAEAAEEE